MWKWRAKNAIHKTKPLQGKTCGGFFIFKKRQNAYVFRESLNKTEAPANPQKTKHLLFLRPWHYAVASLFCPGMGISGTQKEL